MKRLLLYAVIVAILFCGCDGGYFRGSATLSEHQSAIEIVRTAVPHIGCLSMRLDIVQLADTDNCGRKMYQYLANEVGIEIILIEQMSDDTNVYYYEDLCYLIYCNGETVVEEDIAWLKESNDWNKPLDKSKMHCVTIRSGTDNIVDYSEKRSKAQVEIEKLYPGVGIIVSLNGLEVSEDGNQLLLAEVYSQDIGTYEYYLLRCTNAGVVKILQKTTVETIRDDIIACKAK